MTRLEQFLKHVDIPENKESCWPWKGCKNKKGYGQLSRRENGIDLALYSNRFTYELFYGPIPEGFQVCHSCDVPACVNPQHLWIGTNKENAHDAMKKGRQWWQKPNRPRRFLSTEGRHKLSVQRQGQKNPAAKLTEKQVRNIRAEHRAGTGRKELAIKYGVVLSMIGLIVTRKNWASVAD